LAFNTGRPRIAAVAETCDLPFVFFLYGHKLTISFDSSRARECNRAKQIRHKNIQKFSSHKTDDFRCPHGRQRDYKIPLSCWTFAAGRAPTGGEFALPPVRMHPAQKVPPLTKTRDK